MKKTLITAVAISTMSLNLISCGSSSGSSSGTSITQLVTASELLQTLPEDMMISSPTAQRSSSLISALSSHVVHALGDAPPDATATPEEKEAAIEALISDASSTAGCSLNLTIATSGNANCYGPSVSYTNHSKDASNGSWPGGDLGIWEAATASGEACSAAQLNSRMQGVSSLVDVGMYTMAGMACVLKTAGLDLPAESASVDLTSNLSGIVNINGTAVTVTAATVARDADVSSRPVYVYSFTGTAGVKTYTIRLKHVSLDDDDSTYRGKVSVQIGDPSATAQNVRQNCDTSSSTGLQDAVSMSYEKSSSSTATVLLKSANFCGYDADPFESSTNYSVDLTKVFTTSTEEKGWGNNANYFLASFDPTTFAGQYSYAWQAGKGDSHTRTFNTKLTGSDKDSQTGVSFFGYGPTIQSSPGTISGMICAWTGPDSDHTNPELEVQRQNITMSSGKFTATSSYITYDPVNLTGSTPTPCDTTTAMIMTWSGGVDSSRDASTTTKNLVALSQVTSDYGSAPTAPTDVD